MEGNRDPRREGAMETLRAIDQATARIDALIARAGGPVMVARNTQEDELECRPDIYLGMQRIIDEQFGGSTISYIKHLVDTIDRLEAALSNVINEREQLKRDLIYAMDVDQSSCYCYFCAHYDKSVNDTPCDMCADFDEHPCFEWRGVPEEADES